MSDKIVVDDLRVSLATGSVACLVDNAWKFGRVDTLLNGDGDVTMDPSEATCIVVEWQDGHWSPIECEFTYSEATVH